MDALGPSKPSGPEPAPLPSPTAASDLPDSQRIGSPAQHSVLQGAVQSAGYVHLSIGSTVDVARRKGKRWLPGVITAVGGLEADGTRKFTVAYEDGEEEPDIIETEMRPALPPLNPRARPPADGSAFQGKAGDGADAEAQRMVLVGDIVMTPHHRDDRNMRPAKVLDSAVNSHTGRRVFTVQYRGVLPSGDGFAGGEVEEGVREEDCLLLPARPETRLPTFQATGNRVVDTPPRRARNASGRHRGSSSKARVARRLHGLGVRGAAGQSAELAAIARALQAAMERNFAGALAAMMGPGPDVDESGVVSREAFEELLARLGVELPPSQLEAALALTRSRGGGDPASTASGDADDFLINYDLVAAALPRARGRSRSPARSPTPAPKPGRKRPSATGIASQSNTALGARGPAVEASVEEALPVALAAVPWGRRPAMAARLAAAIGMFGPEHGSDSEVMFGAPVGRWREGATVVAQNRADQRLQRATVLRRNMNGSYRVKFANGRTDGAVNPGDMRGLFPVGRRVLVFLPPEAERPAGTPCPSRTAGHAVGRAAFRHATMPRMTERQQRLAAAVRADEEAPGDAGAAATRYLASLHPDLLPVEGMVDSLDTKSGLYTVSVRCEPKPRQNVQYGQLIELLDEPVPDSGDGVVIRSPPAGHSVARAAAHVPASAVLSASKLQELQAVRSPAGAAAFIAAATGLGKSGSPSRRRQRN